MDDKLHGFGIEKLKDSTYEGQYNQGLKNGKGILKLNDGSCKKSITIIFYGFFYFKVYNGEF